MKSLISKTSPSKQRNNRKNGFTLMETVINLAIVGIISAIGLPTLTKEQNKARDSATIATLTNAAKECSLSLVTLGNDSSYLNSATKKPYDAEFVNVDGACVMNGKLTLASPGRTEDTTNSTHIAEVIFKGAIPQIPEFPSDLI